MSCTTPTAALNTRLAGVAALVSRKLFQQAGSSLDTLARQATTSCDELLISATARMYYTAAAPGTEDALRGAYGTALARGTDLAKTSDEARAVAKAAVDASLFEQARAAFGVADRLATSPQEKSDIAREVDQIFRPAPVGFGWG